MTTDITRSVDTTRPDLPAIEMRPAAEITLGHSPESDKTTILPAVNAGSNDLIALTDTPAPAAVVKEDRGLDTVLLPHHLLVLLVIFALQIGLSCRLVWSNTAFEDEALYLWAGHMEWSHWLHQTSIPTFQTYFSGAPVIYPPIAAIADSFGGLAAARLLSLIFMLGATALLYAATTKLFNRLAGVSAAAAFALFGPTQFLSAFATYDAMAIFLLALASWLVIQSNCSKAPSGEVLLVAAGIVLAAADATKYATALWNPVVIGLAIVTATKGTWPKKAFRGARLCAYTAIPISVVLFRMGGPSYIRGILYTTVERQQWGVAAPASLVLKESSGWLWFVAILALAGFISSLSESWRTRLLCGLCTLALILAPAHQAQIHTTTSLKKHVVFGVWFGAIAAGFALYRAAQVARKKGWRIITAAAGIILFIGATQANAMFFNGWPNMNQATKVLATSVPSDCPCLIMSYEVVDYYLIRQINPAELDSIVGPYSFYYNDSLTRRKLSGTSAYVQAVRDHYFNIIELDTGEFFPSYDAIAQAINTTAGYHKIADIPTQDTTNGEPLSLIQIWRYEPGTPNQPGNARGGDH